VAEDLQKFASFINDARVNPRLWHYSYPHLRNNLQMFQEFEQQLRTLQPSAGRRLRLLDIGCGFKPFSSLLDPAKFEVLGVDFSAQMSSADALSTAEALPFANASFDGIILSEVLEHVADPRLAIHEALRVTRPGGLLFISTPFIFWEHGAPYDFQRPTRYFFRSALAGHDTIAFRPSNTILWSASTLACLFVEATPLHRIPPVRYAYHFMFNLQGMWLDFLTRSIGSRLFSNWEDRFMTAPVGYAMLVRVR
jgi:2-polyprenyl-3-methyl-5-hydroxy-6-metoxy-1,4-benzoquinol methylase